MIKRSRGRWSVASEDPPRPSPTRLSPAESSFSKFTGDQQQPHSRSSKMVSPHSTVLAASAVLATLSSSVQAQQSGSSTPEVHPSLSTQQCSSAGGCVIEQTSIVLDANWRWLHEVGGYRNCFTGNQWDASLCPDPATCAQNCALEGVDYSGTYGISTSSGGELALKLVTKHQYGTNVGSRVYLLAAGGKSNGIDAGGDTEAADASAESALYKKFALLNQEFAFDVDVSELPCGLNGALYFVDMDADGGASRFPTNEAGAKLGTGYCDAQCPHDVKFIHGEANVLDWAATGATAGGGRYGSCCAELDIWEANSMSTAFTSHPCESFTGTHRCSSPEECGDAGNRYNGVCDKDGCDFNAYRMGNTSFYGPGAQFVIDSTRKFTIVTQFVTNDGTASGELVDIRRFYQQDGRRVENPRAAWDALAGLDVRSLTEETCSAAKKAFGDVDDHAAKGSLAQLGRALQNGVVLTMSLWTDHAAQCLWLDSSYPAGADPKLPGVARGSCPTSSGRPDEVEAAHPDATVRFSNIRVGDIGSTTK